MLFQLCNVNLCTKLHIPENSEIWKVSLLCICTKYRRNALKLQKMSKYQSFKEAGVSYKQKLVFADTSGQNMH